MWGFVRLLRYQQSQTAKKKNKGFSVFGCGAPLPLRRICSSFGTPSLNLGRSACRDVGGADGLMPRDSHKNALFEPDTTFWENLLSVFLCAGVKLTMKLSTAAAALTSLCLACGPAKAESAKRLADLLTRDNFSPDGLLASKTIASFEGCVLHLTVDKLDACSRGASFEMREEILDVRMLNSGSEDVRVRKVGEGYTALSEVSLSDLAPVSPDT